MSIEELQKNLTNLFNDVNNKDIIRITSGEAYPKITNYYEGIIEEAYKKGARMEVLVGPIICVDNADNRIEGNPYLRLAKKMMVTLFPARSRERVHSIVVGERRVQVENYHPALSGMESRKKRIINDEYIVKIFVYNFIATCKFFNINGISGTPSNSFIYLTEGEIRNIKKLLNNDNDLKYDFLEYEDIISLLKHENIFIPEMIGFS